MGNKSSRKTTFNHIEMRKIRLQAVENSFLLASLVLHDFYGFNDEQIIEFYEKINHYTDLINDHKTTGVTMKYVLQLLKEAGVEIRYVK